MLFLIDVCLVILVNICAQSLLHVTAFLAGSCRPTSNESTFLASQLICVDYLSMGSHDCSSNRSGLIDKSSAGLSTNAKTCISVVIAKRNI